MWRWEGKNRNVPFPNKVNYLIAVPVLAQSPMVITPGTGHTYRFIFIFNPPKTKNLVCSPCSLIKLFGTFEKKTQNLEGQSAVGPSRLSKTVPQTVQEDTHSNQFWLVSQKQPNLPMGQI